MGAEAEIELAGDPLHVERLAEGSLRLGIAQVRLPAQPAQDLGVVPRRVVEVHVQAGDGHRAQPPAHLPRAEDHHPLPAAVGAGHPDHPQGLAVDLTLQGTGQRPQRARQRRRLGQQQAVPGAPALAVAGNSGHPQVGQLQRTDIDRAGCLLVPQLTKQPQGVVERAHRSKTMRQDTDIRAHDAVTLSLPSTSIHIARGDAAGLVTSPREGVVGSTR